MSLCDKCVCNECKEINVCKSADCKNCGWNEYTTSCSKENIITPKNVQNTLKMSKEQSVYFEQLKQRAEIQGVIINDFFLQRNKKNKINLWVKATLKSGNVLYLLINKSGTYCKVSKEQFELAKPTKILNI